MNRLWIYFVILVPLVFVDLIARAQQTQSGENIDVSIGINHDQYDRLLKKHVNEQGLVNYGAWKQNKADLSALEDYLKQFAQKSDNPAQANEKAASLVNAYNAFMLRWILSNYPTESVWSLKDSFTAKRNEIGGRKVSFDDIEYGALRPLIGYHAHAVLVCAARSCPPLQRFAYTGDKFEEQDDQAYRAWLARDDLTVLCRTRTEWKSPASLSGSNRILIKLAAYQKSLADMRRNRFRSLLAVGITKRNICPTIGA